MCCKCATFPCTYLLHFCVNARSGRNEYQWLLWKGCESHPHHLLSLLKKINIPYARSQQGPQTQTLRTLLAPESNGMRSTSDTANGKTTAVLSVHIHRNPHDECILLIKWFSNQMGIWIISRIALHKTLDMPLQQVVSQAGFNHVISGEANQIYDLWDKLMRCWWTVCLSKIYLANICEVNPPRQSWSGLASNWSNMIKLQQVTSGQTKIKCILVHLGTSWCHVSLSDFSKEISDDSLH